MKHRLRILQGARDDIANAQVRYDRESPGLGASFVREVECTLRRIADFPQSYQLDFGAVRRAVVHRFPFCVYYRELPDYLEVAAILDSRLDPANIRRHVAPTAASPEQRK